jgi:type I restriction enzyme S subunit
MSQDLYDLPEGWEWKRLDELCKKITDGSHNPPKEVIIGKPMLSSRNVFDGILIWDNYRLIDANSFDIEDKRTRVDEGDILLTIVGTIGRSCVVRNTPERFTLQRSVAVITPKDDLCADFISLQFRSPVLQSYLNENAKGAAQKGIYLKQLKSINIAVPPLTEQTRIVEKLDAVLSRIDTAIDELQQSLALVDAFYKSSLKAKTNDLEGKWTRYSLNELGCFSGGGTPSKSRSDYWDGEILWITPKDMKSWKLSDSEMKITDIGLKESSAKLLPKNSVLIVARSGILQHTLPVAINTVEATVNQDIKVFIPSDKIVAEYVQYMLKGHEAFILSQLVKGGVTVESLKYSEFQEHPVPVPDLQAQIQIVGELDALNDKTTQLKTELTAKIGMFNQLKASVLDGAFRGEV